MSHKALFILTSHSMLGNTGKKTGYFLSEVSHPYFELINSGVDVDFATIHGGSAPMDPDSYDLLDPLNEKFVTEKLNFSKVESTLAVKNLNPKDYSLIFFPGGHGTVFDLPNSREIAKFVADVYEQGGIVGAVCHGPAGLLNVKLSNGSYLVTGKKINSFTNEEEIDVKLENVVPFMLETELKKRGALFEKAGIQQAMVVVSNRVITGQNPASALGVGSAMAKALKEL